LPEAVSFQVTKPKSKARSIMSLLELFCDIDDFWQMYESVWHPMLLENGLAQRRRTCQMTMSEMMTIMVHCHQKLFRDVKTYYTEYVMTNLQSEFPQLLSYSHFIQLMLRILLALYAYLVQWVHSTEMVGIYLTEP
jgi:hypothetical protein